MKKTMKISVFGVTVAALLLLAGRDTALGQGQINFFTSNADTNHGLVWVDHIGGTLAGTNYAAELYGCTTTNGTFTALGTVTTFVAPGGVPTGVINYGNVTNAAGLPAGSTYYYELVVWAMGATYTLPHAVGLSVVEMVTLGGPNPVIGQPPISTPFANTFPSFVLTQVPEPATLALMGLGSLSLLLFRRKNS
jgi:PEP-CTERM motif